jgi:hypothetical protein
VNALSWEQWERKGLFFGSSDFKIENGLQIDWQNWQ